MVEEGFVDRFCIHIAINFLPKNVNKSLFWSISNIKKETKGKQSRYYPFFFLTKLETNPLSNRAIADDLVHVVCKGHLWLTSSLQCRDY